MMSPCASSSRFTVASRSLRALTAPAADITDEVVRFFCRLLPFVAKLHSRITVSNSSATVC
jgi:hypothetical protein